MFLYFPKTVALKVAFVALLCLCIVPSVRTDMTSDLKTWLVNYGREYQKYLHDDYVAQFDYESDLTDEKQKIAMETSSKLSEFQRKSAQEAQKKFDKTKITDEKLKRALSMVEDVGISISSDKKKLQEISSLTASMLKTYSTACYTIGGECKKLQPNGLASMIATNRDYDTLKDVWKGWRDVSGKKMRKDFSKWAKSSNEAIKEGQYKDLGESWRSAYGPGFVEDVEKLLKDIKPLYELFHAYVRQKLSDKYGAIYFKDGLIPAHLLGNMWAQDWANIRDIVLPYHERLDVTEEMHRQKYNVSMMFHKAEDFFTSIGLKPMTQAFWEKSVFSQIPGKEMVCHASAWDFMAKDDFRIKMCTEITMEDFVTIHHEMGHIQYYQQYEDQPVYFRSGANPGFHEAVGDTLALSVSTPEHLQKLNLTKEIPGTKEFEVNYLMSIAMDKLVFYPYAYIMDKFRWNVFNGEISDEEYTAKWWEYRCEYQGLKAPVTRTEEDFDPGSKMHIAGAVPYIRYFVSYVIQFQFHKALCDEAGHVGPLHKCDIYKNKEAGKKLAEMLKLGDSVSWEEALEKVTGQRHMDAGAMLKYFEPLKDWLEKHTDKKSVGWNCHSGGSTPTTSSLSTYFIVAILYASHLVHLY